LEEGCLAPERGLIVRRKTKSGGENTGRKLKEKKRPTEEPLDDREATLLASRRDVYPYNSKKKNLGGVAIESRGKGGSTGKKSLVLLCDRGILPPGAGQKKRLKSSDCASERKN